MDDALLRLSSTAVADRNKGIAALRDLLSNSSNFKKYGDSTWARVIRQLFEAAEVEKEAFAKPSKTTKSTLLKPAALNRFDQVVGLIRTCVTQHKSALGLKVLKLLMTRTIELIVTTSQHEDFQSITLDCIRILRDFFAHSFHFTHLDQSKCSALIALCFALLLGKRIPDGLVPNSEFSDDEAGIELRPVGPLFNECAQLLSLILKFPTNLCITHSKTLLCHFKRIFQTYSKDSNSHFHLISGLCTILEELHCNKIFDLAQFAPELGNCLMSYWPTKSFECKELIIMSLTYLFPSILHAINITRSDSPEDPSRMAEALVKNIFHTISNETDRVELISLVRLRLMEPTDHIKSLVLSTKAWSWGTFDPSDTTNQRHQVTTWVSLQLGAIALNSVIDLSDRFCARDLMISPRKRRKVENDLEAFLRGMKPGHPPVLVVRRLQLTIFSMDSHWTTISAEAKVQITRSVIELLNSDDASILEWTFLCISNLAYVHKATNRSGTSSSRQTVQYTVPTPDEWLEMWLCAIRRTSTPQCTRAASYAALSILKNELIPTHLAFDGIKRFLSDLCIQGPNIPYDSVCWLVSKCLSLTAEDLMMSNLGFEEKVFIWLSKTWPEVNLESSSGSKRIKRIVSTGFDPESASALLLSLTNLKALPRLGHSRIPPSCPLVEFLINRDSTRLIRDSVFSREVVSSNQTTQSTSSTDKISSSAAHRDLRPGSEIQNMISALLAKSITALIDQLVGTDSQELSPASSYVVNVKAAIDNMIVGMLFESSRRSSGVRPHRQTLKASERLLGILNRIFEAHTWTASQLATLISCFEPILHPAPGNIARYPSCTLSSPGLGSGLPRSKLLDPEIIGPRYLDRISKRLMSFTTCRNVVAGVWTISSGVQAELNNFTEICERLLNSIDSASNEVEVNPSSTQGGQNVVDFHNDDDFDMGSESRDVREGSYPNSVIGRGKRRIKIELGGAGNKRLAILVADVCIRVLLTRVGIASYDSSFKAIDVPNIAGILMNGTGTSIGLIGVPVFDYIDAGLIKLSEIESDELIQHVGNNFLATYEYSHNPSVQLFAIRLLRASLIHWATVDENSESKIEYHAWSLCGHFIGLLFRNSMHPEVRIELALLLDAYLEVLPSYAENWTANLTPNLPANFQNDPRSPVDILIELLQDQNIRVRHIAAFLVPHAFELLHSENLATTRYWSRMFRLPRSTEYELLVTDLLFLVNTLLVSAELRPRAYEILIRGLSKPQDTPEQMLYHGLLLELLETASHQLGFEGLHEMYAMYAAHIAADRHNRHEEPLRIQQDFFGKNVNNLTKLEVARSHLLAVGHLYFLNDQVPAFQSCAQRAGMESYIALGLCFPRVAGELIARAFKSHSPGSADGLVENSFLQTLKLAITQCKLDVEIMSLERDRVVTHLILSVDATGADPSEIAAALSNEHRVQTIYKTFVSKMDTFYITQPSLPCYPATTTIAAIKWVDKKYSVFQNPASVYSVISNIFSAISYSPFVNDHLRFVHALAMCIALSYTLVSKSGPILTLLLQGIQPLFSEESTFLPVCGLAKWIILKIFPLERSPDAPDETEDPDEHQRDLILSTLESILLVAKSTTIKEQNLICAHNFRSWLLDHLNKDDQTKSELEKAVQLYWPDDLILQPQSEATKDLLSKQRLGGPSSLRLIKHFVSSGLPKNQIEAGKLLYSLLISARHSFPEPSLNVAQSYLHLLSKNSGILTLPRLGHHNPWEKSLPSTPRSWKSEPEIIQDIIALAISHLGTRDPRILSRLTEFIRRASACEDIPDFSSNYYQISSSILQKTRLVMDTSLRRSYDLYQSPSASLSLEFSSLLEVSDRASDWILSFLKILIFDRLRHRPFFAQLFPVLELDEGIASEVLPRVVHAYLLRGLITKKTAFKNDLSNHICALLQSSSTGDAVVQQILALVTNLRSHSPPGNDPLGCDKWLNIPWLTLVKHATALGMPASGFMFLEIGREQGQISDLKMDSDKEMQEVVHRLYSLSIEPDAFYSIPPRDSSEWLLEQCCHEGQWESAFGIGGAMLQGATTDDSHRYKTLATISQSQSNCGLDRLAHHIFKGESSKQTAERAQDLLGRRCDTLPFELAWRASAWDLPQSDQLNMDSSTRLYGALKAINRQRDVGLQTDIVNSCIIGQFKDLVHHTLTQSQPDTSIIATALALNDVASWLKSDSLTEKLDSIQMLVDLPQTCEYDVLERVSAVRRCLLDAEMNKQAQEVIGDEPTAVFHLAQQIGQRIRIKTSQEARRAGRIQNALNIIAPSIISGSDGMKQISLETRTEFAEVLWMKGNRAMALHTLNQVKDQQRPSAEAFIQLARLGHRLGTERVHKPADIIDVYFEKAIQSVDKHTDPSAFSHVSFTYATYADQQYREILASGEALKSSEPHQPIAIDATQRILTTEERLALEWKNHTYKEDIERLATYNQMRERYLREALRMYLNSLAYGDQYDEVVFRFVSLWFDQSTNKNLNTLLMDEICNVPTYKFVRVVNQLSTRLSQDKSSNFQDVLTQLLIRMCNDHPFHCLPPILLLRRGISLELEPCSTRSRRSSQVIRTNLNPAQLARAQAADTVVTDVHKISNRSATVQDMMTVHEAYTEWAMYISRQDRTKLPSGTCATIPPGIKLIGLRDLAVPVATNDLPIDKTCKYDPSTMVCISGYMSKYRIATGLSTPKITDCRGTDGRLYKQLFKGRDDVRQDAVMEQVFELVNEVLKRDQECRKRRLNFRPYKVIPLTPEAGVIEFVSNTTALQEVLSKLHARYNEPEDWNIARIRRHLQKGGKKLTAAENIALYKDLMSHVRPAMRFWFMESQKCPKKWYEMRLNYTRSTATTSIVGHILGLGDRHLSNILLDKETGDMVQIDLGIAFDAGRYLPIPEKVPFRLTPDVVDGFGIAKTEGVFRRCCEHTLRVLREHKNLVLTIIDVLKHDPLQKWILTEEKARRLQQLPAPDVDEPIASPRADKEERLDDSKENISEHASRALAAVERKLSPELSVQTMVSQLIMDATNVEHLGTIFIGWSPYY
ncbi:hypothetical protein CROQUDRAFT_80653 [Cronartium quercuum f. sp. fusiforme G11]|uniref:Serine/threonine-protein kinase Tel1 n=1 Tax=Cronartium quercuum f. sp. fusiforme G11 TaxID=708437 RepID=A0A9P6T9Q7_9BASI|nr:hypothetical protein CROQUDRAFT_80653 [Cronartium quercuum f. sp. fusiforme G11]